MKKRRRIVYYDTPSYCLFFFKVVLPATQNGLL